ncbi:unnamed protein product [Chironomus riparius]|uniref:F-box domain-containing protein n=1 Tax=Chironomus riparius TaxID=315576 RepID=A0A9P0NAW6_9DIPT|nr:unnamed protein product [Chironomus riparius]
MSGPKLSDLPDEILENIFKQLDDYYGKKTIKSLTEVFSRFNDIISGSTDLMKLLTVYWSPKKDNDIGFMLASKRKYQNISIKKVECVDESLLTFLNKNPFADVSIQNSSLNVQELRDIIKAVAKNIEKLNLDELELSSEAEHYKDLVDFPKLEKIRITGIECKQMSQIFKLFRGATNVIKFDYNDQRRLEVYEAYQFSRMVACFDGLKNLQLHTFEPYFFNDDYFAKNATFQLQKYSHESTDGEYGELDFEPMDYEEQFANGCVHLKNFLNRQRASLESMRINRFPISSEIVDSILAMDKLSFLALFKCVYRTSKPITVKNKSIKMLKIGHFHEYDEEYREGQLDRDTEIGYTAILSNCLNVEDLSLFNLEVTSGISMCIALYMKSLESITFVENGSIFPMTFASVKTMDFSVIRFMDYNDVLKLLQTISSNIVWMMLGVKKRSRGSHKNGKKFSSSHTYVNPLKYSEKIIIFIFLLFLKLVTDHFCWTGMLI